jgi:hypothetical protein
MYKLTHFSMPVTAHLTLHICYNVSVHHVLILHYYLLSLHYTTLYCTALRYTATHTGLCT